jgi:hypothetical protein
VEDSLTCSLLSSSWLVQVERQAASAHLHRAADLHEQEVSELRRLHAELLALVRARTEEAARLQVMLRGTGNMLCSSQPCI